MTASPTMETVSEALKLFDSKKEDLRKAFEDVQAHSSFLSSSFTLSWSDLNSHFSSIQSSLTDRFNRLQSQNQTLIPPQNAEVTLADSSTQLVNTTVNSTPPLASTKVVRSCTPELRSFCEKMDGKEMRIYIMNRLKNREYITAELSDALSYAPDAAKIVLEALEDAQSMSKGMKIGEFNILKRTNVILLEKLVSSVKKEEINGELKEKAKKLAMELKGQISEAGEDTSMEALEILHLLDIYGIVNEFDVDEVVHLIILSARYRGAINFCRELGLVDKAPEIAQKLIDKGNRFLAVKFICEFNLTDKFPPVPLLKAHAKEAKKAAHTNQFNQSHKETMAKAIHELKLVLKSIEDYKLESEYPQKIVEKQIEKIEKMKQAKKHPAPTKPNAPKAQRIKSNCPSSSHPKTTTGFINAQQRIQQPPRVETMPGLLPDPYLVSLPGAGPLYSITGAGNPNPNPSGTQLYSSDPQMAAPGYYNSRQTAAYSLPIPQYHPGYFPHPQ